MAQKGNLLSVRKDIRVVDATIRDGGLCNDFRFTDKFVKDLYEANVKAGVDYMEFGYKASKELFDVNKFGKWKFCDEADIRAIVGENNSDMKIAVMADVGRCDYKNDILPKSESLIDMIRVATYVHQMPAAIDMIEDCKARGLSPVICSSYRTLEKQQSLFESEVQSYMQQGHSRETAEKIAATSVAIPDTSEHQLGLAVDIVDINNQRLETEQEDTDVQKWLMANSWKYGFILRYPKDKTDITGTIYEPWHYRYVGKESAIYMHNHNLCLEEFIDFVKAERKAQSAEKSEASANADIKSEEDD